jgi:hypothetical protein
MALTIQEIGTMIKAKCKTIVFVINNDGYTVERLIWGAQQGQTFLSSPLSFFGSTQRIVDPTSTDILDSIQRHCSPQLLSPPPSVPPSGPAILLPSRNYSVRVSSHLRETTTQATAEPATCGTGSR